MSNFSKSLTTVGSIVSFATDWNDRCRCQLVKMIGNEKKNAEEKDEINIGEVLKAERPFKCIVTWNLFWFIDAYWGVHACVSVCMCEGRIICNWCTHLFVSDIESVCVCDINCHHWLMQTIRFMVCHCLCWCRPHWMLWSYDVAIILSLLV